MKPTLFLVFLIFSSLTNISSAQQGTPFPGENTPPVMNFPAGMDNPAPVRSVANAIYKINNTCPFYVDTRDFSEQISGVNKYLNENVANQKACDQKLNMGDPLSGAGGFMQAMNDYRQLMGLNGGGFGGAGLSLNCFNVDEYYKNKAETYLIGFNDKIANRNTTPMMDMGTWGGGSSSGASEKSFAQCDGKTKEEVEGCLAEIRVYNVALKKKTCEQDENYQKQKKNLELSLDAIQSARGTILQIIQTPECRDRLPGHVVSSLVTLGASAAALAAPGVGGVAASAAADIVNTAIKLYTTDNTAKKL